MFILINALQAFWFMIPKTDIQILGEIEET